MHPKGYFIFHLNLAFSSVDKGSWSTIVDNCYWPLLEIISDLKVPLGIEVSGWTLIKIQETCPEWVDKFRQLLSEEKCELIGSGYCQIIAPLVPYEVNIQNHKIGLDLYHCILGVRPTIALVNEMAFSDSVIDLLTEVGYSGFIMDRDNIRLAIETVDNPLREMPTLAKGVGSAEMPVLWADSILFQKLQHVSHGDISMDDYVAFIETKLSMGQHLLPLYCNDAETFDFRPGRFKEERKANPKGEWEVIRNLLSRLKADLNFTFVLPSTAFSIQKTSFTNHSRSFTSASYPTPVKKQAKYNIARWSITGRDDTWLNTMCYRIYEKLKKHKFKDLEDWKNICELWASDFRTHITDTRWFEVKERVANTLKSLNLSEDYGFIQSDSKKFKSVLYQKYLGEFKCRVFGDGIYLEIENEKTTITLNLRRGLAIDSLIFSSHGTEDCIGTLKHGSRDSILQGADYYSGGIIIEIPKSSIKITDLKPVEPSYLIEENGDLTLRAVIDTDIGEITKYFKISSVNEEITISYRMSKIKRLISSARVGNFTLSPKFSRSFERYSCHTGGFQETDFQVIGSFNQSKAATSFVSSSSGFYATTGQLYLDCAKKNIFFSWNPSECSPLCFIDHEDDYTRISFSICEVDESTRESKCYGDLTLRLSSSKF